MIDTPRGRDRGCDVSANALPPCTANPYKFALHGLPRVAKYGLPACSINRVLTNSGQALTTKPLLAPVNAFTTAHLRQQVRCLKQAVHNPTVGPFGLLCQLIDDR